MCSSVDSVHCSDELQLQPVLLLEDERRVVNRLRLALADDLLQVVDEAFGMLVDVLAPGRLVLEGDLHAAMQVARHLEPLADGLRRRTRPSGRSSDRDGRTRVVPLPRAAPVFFRAPVGLPLLEAHLPLRAVAPHGGRQLARQRIDDAGADAVQAARRLVVAGLELAAGVEHREDHLERALLRLRVHIHRDAAAIVLDGDRRGVLVQRDADVAPRARSSPRRWSCRAPPRPDDGGRRRRRRRCTCRGVCEPARGLRER